MMPGRARREERGIVYIIYNSIPPYAYETNNILALPNDMPYRARFRKGWCPDLSSTGEIENRSGLLVLRNWETASLIPLRRVKITDVDPVGDIYHISYILKDLVEFDTELSVQEQQLTRFNEQMALELRPFPNNPQTDLTKLIFQGPDLTVGITDTHSQGTTQQREFDNWGKIINLIGVMECFRDIDFLKIVRVIDSSGKSQGFVSSDGITRYSLTNDRVYSLEVFQRSYTQRRGDSSVSNRVITLQGETDAIKQIKDRFAIVGKYDRFQFRFKTQVSQRLRDIDLSLDISRSDNKGPIPSIFLPIRITIPLFTQIYRFLSLLVFILGSILLFLSDRIFPSNTSLSQSIGIFMMIMTGTETREFVASIIDRIGLGFRK